MFWHDAHLFQCQIVNARVADNQFVEFQLDDPNDAETVATVKGDASLVANFATVASTATLTMAISPENSGETNPGAGSHTVIAGKTYEISAESAEG